MLTPTMARVSPLVKGQQGRRSSGDTQPLGGARAAYRSVSTQRGASGGVSSCKPLILWRKKNFSLSEVARHQWVHIFPELGDVSTFCYGFGMEVGVRGRLSASLWPGWAAQPMEPTTLGTGISQALGYACHPPLLLGFIIYIPGTHL